MASILIRYEYAEGGSVVVRVSGKTSYPDALSELLHTALTGYAEVMGDAMAGDE